MVYNAGSGWVVDFCNPRAKKEVADLPQDLQASFAHIVQLIKTYGMDSLHDPHAKHLAGKLWELRLKGRSGIARSIYVTAQDKRIIILHSFIKKTQQTPKGALELALKRAKEGGYI